MADENVVVTKGDIDPTTIKSPVDTPSVDENYSPHAHPIVITMAAQAQSVTPWGVSPRVRDKELRAFWVSEPWLASVVYSVSIRNASFAWEVVGADPSKPPPRNTIRLVERILNNSNRGKGWINLITKTCNDLYTQDNGAFWYLARAENKPGAPVMNILHLDAGQCMRTGDPRYPVIYTNRRGIERVMNWWEIQLIEEFPSPIESAFDMQISAVSRCLLAAEIIQSIAVYKQEKISGTFARSIDLVSGVTRQNIDDGLALGKEQVLNRGLLRYSIPVIIPGIDPTVTLSHVHIDLASLPDNFNEDTSFTWYVAQLAAAFGVDYQEIAPLMTGTLGSSQQSEIMHLKTRGKGPALIMGILENIINGGIIPGNVKFRFLEQDLRSESEKANAAFTRSKDRAMRIKSGELTPAAARRLAVEQGDMPEWLAEKLDREETQRDREIAQQEQTSNEFGANQVDGGIETQEQQNANQ